jgi:predicted enzyme related to lactoylglutathione lyase
MTSAPRAVGETGDESAKGARTAMILKLGNIAFDCDDVLKVATFWSAVLGRPLDDGSGDLFASIGGSDPSRAQPAWYFTKVPEPKQAKNRVHLDLTTPDPSAVDELQRLGATVVSEHELPGGGHSWTVMRDPEGNEFCVAAKSFTGWDY